MGIGVTISLAPTIFIDIHLMKGPTMAKYNGKNCSNGSWFNYQVECVMIINAKLLVKVFCNKSCLITRYTPIKIQFYSENLLVTNDILLWIRWNKLSFFIYCKSIKLINHCCTPIWITKGNCGN